MPRILLTFVLLPLFAGTAAAAPPVRPPAIPLVTHDPYFSIWSMTDKLTDSSTQHWTGTAQSMTSLVKIDGKTYRLMGTDPVRTPDNLKTPALAQTSVTVLPTHTNYEFAGAGVTIHLSFLTPSLPRDLDILSRPVTYITWQVASTDSRSHSVSIYFDASYELAVNTPDQLVNWSRFRIDGADVLRLGSQAQDMLKKSGDNLRIDWGYLYLFAPSGSGVSNALADRRAARSSFIEKGKLPEADNLQIDAPARFRMPVLAYRFDLGDVGAQQISRYVAIAYDDIYSVEYFKRPLRPWWHNQSADISSLLTSAIRDYQLLESRSADFDRDLMADLKRSGGDEYAGLCALAYRQTVAAHKLTRDLNGDPLLFSKENFSNGSIDTVDVTYPSAPFFLLFNPKLLEAQIRPILDYASLERWKFPFAPHDLGTYPLANGQTYGGGELTEENQMPVEESGNMLLMVAADAQIQGNTKFAEHYWPVLTKWAAFLKEKGLDPENQLSTDDFAGHLAHNSNLSIKAILALGAYGKLAGLMGKTAEANEYRRTVDEFAKRWIKLADDGDHYRLAFDKTGTWSMKYNLVWDRLLGLNIFPPDIAKRELAYYRSKENAFGLPLDNRETYTKLDWLVWTASLSDSPAEFQSMIKPAYRFANESPTRVPLSDWYWTLDGKQRGFQARSVVGGIFIKMLNDPATWRKWAISQ
jgi:hypothetical protein